MLTRPDYYLLLINHPAVDADHVKIVISQGQIV